jgi:GWxTD domain-containing protein
MAGALGFRFLSLVLSSFLAATLPQLFQKAKDEFRFGSYAAALATLDALEAQSTQPGRDTERAALLPGLLFYRGASLAALGRPDEARQAFDAFLSIQPNARLDPAVYPKSVIAALESARESRGQPQPPGGPMLAGAYRAFPRPDAGATEKPGEGWAEGPIRYLLSPEEKENFSHLLGPVSRSEFVISFWKSRDPKPETEENEFREEFEKRVAFADSRFTQDEVRGCLTDRGMVFILMGPPAYGGRKPLMAGEDVADASGLSRYSPGEVKAAGQPGGSNADRQARIDRVSGAGTKILDASSNWIEVWHYLRANLPKEIPYQEVVFEFVTKQGYGKNVLQRGERVLSALELAKTLVRRAESTRAGNLAP